MKMSWARILNLLRISSCAVSFGVKAFEVDRKIKNS